MGCVVNSRESLQRETIGWAEGVPRTEGLLLGMLSVRDERYGMMRELRLTYRAILVNSSLVTQFSSA
jgi:hypothetical protein